MNRISMTIVAILAALMPSFVAAAENEIELVQGKPEQATASVGVTFWTVKNPFHVFASDRQYKVLDASDEQKLLDGVRIEAPPGIAVRQDRLTVVKQKAKFSYRVGRQETTVKYDEYRIEGKWTLTVSPDAESGPFKVKIHLPAVARARTALGALHPEGETWIELSGISYPTAESRASARWAGNFFGGLGCLLGLTFCVAGLGFSIWALFYARAFHALLLGAMFAVGGYFSAPSYVEYMGLGLADLMVLSSAAGIGSAVGINVGYFGLFWFASGLGRWGRTWGLCLGLAVVFVVLGAGVVLALPPTLPRTAALQAGLPWAVGAILPGLTLACLAALVARPSESSPSDDRSDAEGLEDVCRYLDSLPRRNAPGR